MSEIIDVYRREDKYKISMLSALKLIKVLSEVLPADPHNTYGFGYLVRSLYFDSIDDADFFEKEDGVKERKKIRLRIYNPDTETAKLEIKRKSGNNQRKRSFTLSKAEALQLIQGEFSFLLDWHNPVAEDVYAYFAKELYRPKCIVQYQRLAFAVPTNDIRITFDSNLQASESNLDLFDKKLNLYPADFYDNVTLEVKYSGFLLTYIKDLLDNCGKTAISYSKYYAARGMSRILT